MSSPFSLHAPFAPSGDQPEAIEKLVQARSGCSTLLGVTGSGKTYTMAQVIARQSKPVLVLSPNKTLAAQLYEEFSQFFPENKVGYFVSYYDYYQPESYLPAQDVYIPKETRINSEIERLRVEATASLMRRPDTIIVASVSCMYSLGNPADFKELAFFVSKGEKLTRKALVHKLIAIQYERNDTEQKPGTFQVRGTTIEVNVPYAPEALRVDLFGDRVQDLAWVDKHNKHIVGRCDDTCIFPARHFVTSEDKKQAAITSIEAELEQHLPTMQNQLYKDRLRTRVKHDIELLYERGMCPGIENYSIHFDGRAPGQTPYTLFDYFDDFLLIIDESHIALPQMRGMYAGDRARKQSLVDFGFRLPSAFDNRPLRFEEAERYFKDVIFVSATPGPYELQQSDTIVEQIIRPTGLVDPKVEVHPRENQLDHLMQEVREVSQAGYRTLVTVLTKKLAEELARYLEEHQVRVCYLHSDLKTPQRTELLHKLRDGTFECLVGVNLLREGLDLPEVARVAIMDADVESFLRDKRSLIQTIGRAARNTQAKVLLYGDTITDSMRQAIDETERRREKQMAYNAQHGITPKTVTRDVTKSISRVQQDIAKASAASGKKGSGTKKRAKKSGYQECTTQELERRMHEAAENMDFETAIKLRDELRKRKEKQNKG